MALAVTISNLSKQVKQLDKDIAKTIGEELSKLVPKGATLVWDQYTDYFNDGEPCTFGVHDVRVVNDNDRELDEYELDDLPEDERPVSTQVLEAVEEARDLFGEELLLRAFGDHAKVTLTARSCRRDDYREHD